MKRVEGKVAIVTGAGSGIGEAIAKLLAGEGARVVLAATTPARGQRVEREIGEAGGEAAYIRTDVASLPELERLVGKTVEKYGRIDILVNNAGIPAERDDSLSDEKLGRVIDVNLKGPFRLSRLVVPYMKKQGGGSIVNISSTGGLHATGGATAYNATKSGVIMMTRNMARVLAGDGIRVNCVAPAQIETPIWWVALDREPTPEEVARERVARAAPVPMGRTGRPEEVAAAVLFLASDEASFVNGAVLPVDGGESA